jgi:hypothetical protein
MDKKIKSCAKMAQWRYIVRGNFVNSQSVAGVLMYHKRV